MNKDKEELKQLILQFQGNEFEEAIFKSELMQKQMMADMPQDDAIM